jgi:molybdopterin converting factor small subunit
MRITLRLASYLRPLAADQSTVTLSGDFATVADALAAVWALHPAVRHRVLDETGALRQHVNVFVGQDNTRFTGGLATLLTDNAEVSILPAVSGG